MLYRYDGKAPKIGNYTYISELANVIGDVVIGDHCYIGHGAILRGDYGRIEIGDGTAVEEGVIIHAPPDGVNKIGNRVTIGHGAIVHGGLTQDNAVIGMGAIVSIWAQIGEYTIIAEGGVVKMNQVVPSGVVAAGNPVRVVREVSQKDKELWEYGKQLYIDLAEKYLRIGMEPIKDDGKR